MHGKNLRFKIIVLCALFVAGALAVVFFAREPSADGRTLSEWVRLTRERNYNADNTDVTNAVRKIGVRGIPVLIDKLQAHDPAWKIRLAKKLPFGWSPDRWLGASGYHNGEALYGFSILGTGAVSTIPELSKMLLDTNAPADCGRALGYIGPQSLPVLRQALTNSDYTIRQRGIDGITATPETALITLPEIIALRNDSKPSVRHFALYRAGPVLPDEELLRVVESYLADTQPGVQERALYALAYVKTNTVMAVPLAMPFLNHSNFGVRRQATNTLIALDPVVAAAHGVRTNLHPRSYYSPRTGL